MNYTQREFEQLNSKLLLIASENYPSQAILDASGSIFQLPYTEGFPGQRYYCGCEIVDEMEKDCQDKLLTLFNATDDYYANVQPNSGASANMIVYHAVLKPGDTVMAMDVKGGGHISHSHPKNFISRYFDCVRYDVEEDGKLDYDKIAYQAMEYHPKLIVCGASNYSLEIDFKKFREIADDIGAMLMADIAHISLLVAKGLHNSPVGLADFITSTTHKCLKGPRGAFIIYKKEYDKQIRLSTIPGLFGGPLQHQIYAKLQCFNEALHPDSQIYAENIVKNAKAMSKALLDNNIPIVSGRTENHLMTLDLRDFDISGKEFAKLLEECDIISNCNTVPKDPRSFLETSGVRIGTPAITARGLDEEQCYELGTAIARLARCFKFNEDLSTAKENLKTLVEKLVIMYPLGRIYQI